MVGLLFVPVLKARLGCLARSDDLFPVVIQICTVSPAAAAWRRDPGQAPPGGESFADTARRVNRACDRLLRDHGGQTVLVVSHVTPIKIMLCRALGVPLSTLYRLYLGSACINEIQWHGRGFAAVHRVNDTSHLP